MSSRMFCLFSLIFLLVIPGIFSQEWQVQYTNKEKCVLKGSTTRFSGTFKHPSRLTVTEIFWIVNPEAGKDLISLLDQSDYRDRVQYFPIKDQTSVLKLSNVRQEDKGMYCLRIVTNEAKERFMGFPGIQLTVTELRVEIPEEVVEKDSPVLFCKTSCNLSDRTNFTWYKNGKRFSEWSDTNRLLLQSVSSDDTGNYSCAARDQEHLSSPAVALSVRYPPKSVSVSVSPSEIVSGDSVTLICSSDSNPPALNFSWFKGGTFLGSGDTYSISNITSESSGNYCCSAENKHGSQSSPAVTVNVMYPPKNVSVSVSPCCEIVSGDSVTLNCSSDSNPPALNFSWFKEDETSAVGSGQSFSISSFSSSFSGRFYCKAQNKYGRERSASVSLSLAGGWTAGLYVAAGIGAVLICTCVIVVVIKITRKTRDPGVRGGLSKQEDSSAAVADQMSACDSGVQNDLIYSSIDHKRPRKHQSAGDEDEVQYATVHHRRTENTSVRAEGPSGDVRDLCPAESARSDDSSVIYSSINVA